MKTPFIILIVLFAALARCIGQGNDYPFSKLDFRDGLSNNQVNCIYKDAKGFMWFGTISGLNRYDGYQFKIFRHSDLDSSSLIDDNIFRIFEGPEGKLWIKTQSDINIYDPGTEKFDRHPENFLRSSGMPEGGLFSVVRSKNNYYFIYADSGVYVYEPAGRGRLISGSIDPGTQNSSITDAARDSGGNLWVVHFNGIIEEFGKDENRIIFRSDILQKQQPRLSRYFSIFVDGQNEVWLYQTSTTSSGLYKYDPSLNDIMYFSKDLSKARLSSNAIKGISQDNKGLIWVVTDHGGITMIDKKRLTAKYLTYSDDDNKSIPENSINYIYKDDIGNIWLGTSKKGIGYYDENRIVFPLYQHKPSSPTSLSYDDIDRFVEDKKGNLWIGANGGGIIYFDRRKNSFKQFKHEKSNSNSLADDVVIALCLDHNDKLWIGTYFGGMDCYDGRTFRHYRHLDSIRTSLADDRVYHIFEDRENNFWVGTLNGGLDRFDRKKNIFYHNNVSIPYSIHSNNITSLMEDVYGNLWIGTTWGIDMLEKSTGKFIHFTDRDSKLSYDNVNSIFQDHAGNIWVSTRRGLNVMQKGKNSFESFFIKDGLPDDYTLDILEDGFHHLWVSTKSGISRIEIARDTAKNIKIHCTNYNEFDGLQGHEFNDNAAFQTREGELIFGGANGFNLFRPDSIKSKEHVPPLVLTDLKLFNNSIGANDKIDGHIILQRSISETGKIDLRYNENDFSLGFAALSYASAEKNRYAYMLEGFNKQWIITNSKNRSATYTNIDPGEYIFHLKGSNRDGVWNEIGLPLKITVLPPFWKTSWAYFGYFLLIVTILYFARRTVIKRAKARFVLSQERREAHRMHELDMMKIKFLTNVSHEFRTPLSLIMAPVEKFITVADDPGQKKQFQLIHRNARRLLNLVDQLLDFRKMEVNELKLNVREGDIVTFIRDISYSFTDLADKKNIRFSYKANTDRLDTYFDHDKTERILFNLLSNAFKFTPEDGEVEVKVNEIRAEGLYIEIKVQDTGIGIAPDKQQKIFERFFQNTVPDSILNQGSGIGLAITKEFIEMSRGTISVTSAINEGSCFTILLPLKDAVQGDAIKSDPSFEDPDAIIPENEHYRPRSENIKGKKATVLLVEDNEDLLFYLKDNLREYFNIVEATNGKEGWQKALSAHPDLIVSDISMPLMNGVELCEKVKTDLRTRHISFIMLTAMAGQQQELKALETGPNDYITKPFNFEILLSKIKNLLAHQMAVKSTYQKQQDVTPSEIKMDTPDENDFLSMTLQIIEKNMSNPDFSVENLAQELLLSRTGMYKKILMYTGKTPNEFIRSIRLKRAAQLLEKSNQNITEIAYMVGFSNPKYFTRCFKEEYDMLPSVYQHERKGKR